MKACIRRTYGSPNTIKIEETPDPVPKKNEVLIRVFATTVNRTDCAILTAKPFIMRFFLGLFKPEKIILGTDFAGEIVATGKDVTTFAINDRVYGFNDMGSCSQSEYLTIPENGNLLKMPLEIDYKVAAASLEGAHYAYSFIHKVKLNPGQRILIIGATGAIGSALLQFVSHYDLHVSATCDTNNIGLIKSLGAHRTYDYTREDFTEDNTEYDFIFDAAGKSTFGECKPLLKKTGIYISSEPGAYSQNLFLALFTSLPGRKRVIFPVPYSFKRTLPYINNLLSEGRFRPVIDREYSLEDIKQAYEYVLSGRKTGNVIINI